MTLWLKDPKDGKRSVTVTLLTITFVVALAKIMFSGLTIAGFQLDKFTGSDFAAMVGAMGAVYGFRKHTDKKKES